ncbi:hypothetical protein ADN00_04695 [Ornatilinea apprima]|uniref:Uncharacterized protein n=1 Tax=Ornatilinea apprima TaxID=1134406 RepID=A0A0P6XG55_9CHLR|nr:hypothetical protein [Ornatilinea apprima]KPL79153.1 hypothetical protein ADN00_04695 [Ornatilinea apprima]
MKKYTILLAGALLLGLLLAACAAPAPAVEPTVAPPAELPTATLAPTSTPTTIPPTATPLPTDTPEPTPTPQLALEADGFSAWCLPQDSLDDPASFAMPEYAQVAQIVDGLPELITEVKSCTFLFQFNQPAPAGLVLEMYDTRETPFLSFELQTNPDEPRQALAYSVNPYVIDPPFWTIDYNFVLRSAGGDTLWESPVRFRRGWTPKLCWGGVWPDPATLDCPWLGEAHPWDAWYGFEEPYPDGIR